MVDNELAIKTASEINDVLGLQPSINLEVSIDILHSLIKKVGYLITCSDNFSDDVTKYLLELDCLPEDVATLFDMKLNFVVEEEKKTKRNAGKKDTQLDVEVKDKRKVRKPHLIRLEQLISEGKYTAIQIITIIMSENSELKKDTIANYIRSTKSEKYTQFQYVAIEDLQGVLRFDETLKV